MAHANGIYNTKDLTMSFMCMGERNVGHYLQDLVTIDLIDMDTIGCVACEVVLSSSLIFRESYKQRMQRSAEIENWSSNIYRLALNNIVPMLKPGNPGKRDSKIVLILQKMIFDEKMTTFEYEFLNSMRRVTGVAREILKMSCASVIIAWYFAK